MTVSIFRLALRDLLRHRSFLLLFVANLILGQLAFLSLDQFKRGIASSIEGQSRDLLGADLSISSRRDLSDAELAEAQSSLQALAQRQTKMVEMFSMVNGSKDTDGARLVQLRAAGPGFPFFSGITLTDLAGADIKRNIDQLSSGQVWVYQDLLFMLDLSLGDSIRLGQKEFVIAGVIRDDPGSNFTATMAPRVYLRLEDLDPTELYRPGQSTAFVSYLWELQPGVDTEELRLDLLKLLKDPAIRVNNARTSGEQVSRLLQYLGDYMGLVALVGLLFSALGSVFLFRAYLVKRLRELAILKVLGSSTNRILLFFLFQMIIMCVVSVGASAVLAQLGTNILVTQVKELSLVDIRFGFSFASLFLVFTVNTIGTFFVLYPWLHGLRQLSPRPLLQEQGRVSDPPVAVVWFLLPLVYFYGLSVFQSSSWKVGSLFFALLLASLAIFWALGLGLTRIVPVSVNVSVPLKLAFLQWKRGGALSVFLFSVLSLAFLLTALIPQIERVFRDELEKPDELPTFFLFDIQDEQQQPLRAFVQTELRMELKNLSPLIRARLMQINGKDYEKIAESERVWTREEEEEIRFRNRGVNLSYRETLSPSETVTEGEPWVGRYQEADGSFPPLSVERDYARRVGLELGDQMTFDIQGIEITGVIRQFRKVRWASFEPNFFVQFPTQVLEDAPKTFLATLKIDSANNSAGPDRKSHAQRKIVENFPNISMIDVELLVSKVMGIVDKMGAAVLVLSLMTVASGVLVFFSILFQELERRRWDLWLLSILGMTRLDRWKSIGYEYVMVLGFAAGVGLGLSTVMATVLAAVLF